ncbi:MAG: hypothetical protein GX770_06145 [Firmicutes bacterium]|nr:hypothetical protein [Bacillota bacterium]
MENVIYCDHDINTINVEYIRTIARTKAGFKNFARGLEIVKAHHLKSLIILIRFFVRVIKIPFYKLILIYQLNLVLKEIENVLRYNPKTIFINVSEDEWCMKRDYFLQIFSEYYDEKNTKYRRGYLDNKLYDRYIIVKDALKRLSSTKVKKIEEGELMNKQKREAYKDTLVFLSIYVLIMVTLIFLMVFNKIPFLSGAFGLLFGSVCIYSTLNVLALWRKKNAE